MNPLIATLKTEHAEIMSLLHSAKNCGIGNPQGRALLTITRRAFLEHVKKENQTVYRPLRQTPQAQQVDAVLHQLSAVSHDLFAFFKKYERGGARDEFTQDISHIIDRMGQRIHQEENLLFTLVS